MHTYKAKVLEQIPNPSPYGRLVPTRTRIGVFRIENDREEQIGEYVRGRLSFFNTFCYFRKGDREFALYAPNAIGTRLMELPTCKDIGGEEPLASGFCPTDFYVPSYMEYESIWENDRVRRTRVTEPNPEYFLPRTAKYGRLDEKTGKSIQFEVPSYPVTPLLYYSFGFVAGYMLGDDTTDKIQYLDLSEAEKGIVKPEERFGYIVLPDKLNLREAVDMRDYLYDPEDTDPDTRIIISIQKQFDLQTGKMSDYPF